MKRLFRPTNNRIRIGVGLLLIALFCIHCTSSSTVRTSPLVTAVSAEPGPAAGQSLKQLEQLAQKDHVALLRQALAHYDESFQDYTCTFIKQERINGQVGEEQWMAATYREKPFTVCLKWTKNSPIGDQVLYEKGKYDGQMLVRPRGALLAALVGTVLRPPEGPEAMAATLRPVTMFGFRNILENLLSVYEVAERRGECVSKFLGYKEVAGRKALVLRRDLPCRADYPAKVTVWYLDLEYLVPLGVEGYDWDDQLSSSYVFKDMKFNVGLKEADFDPAANGFPVKKK